MNHSDKFPPNRFLKKYLTPGRTFLGLVAFVTLEVLGGKFFPHQTQLVATYFLMGFAPFSVSLLVWDIVWHIKNPAPPRERCPNCHQLMPERDNE